MRRSVSLALVGILLGGACGREAPSAYRPPEGATTSVPAPSDPEAALHEQIRSGSVQLEAAASSIRDAYDFVTRMARGLEGDVLVAMEGVADFLDSAGSAVTDAAADPPTVESVRSDFAAADDDRKRRIDAGVDAHQDLIEARGVLTALLEADPRMAQARDLIDTALSDLEEAVQALGGRIPPRA